MKKQEIIDKVNATIAKKAGVNIDTIKPEITYQELGIELWLLIEILMEIGNQFVINISEDKLLNTNTMQDIYNLVGQTIVDIHGFQLY